MNFSRYNESRVRKLFENPYDIFEEDGSGSGQMEAVGNMFKRLC